MTHRVIQIPAQFTRVARRADNSVALTFVSTQEIPAREFMPLDMLIMRKAAGWVLFSENEFTDADVPSEDAPDGKKKPSQRLRAVLYRSWEQNNDGSEDAEQWYRRRMERIIDDIKEELD